MTHVHHDWTGQLHTGCTESFDWLWQLQTPPLVFSTQRVCLCVRVCPCVLCEVTTLPNDSNALS